MSHSWRATALALSLPLPLTLAACSGPGPRAPLRLLETQTVEGRLARAGALTSGGDTRPALLESARYRVRLPRRALLTFATGLSYREGDVEPPGWYQLTVRASGRVLADKRLNPRLARGFRDVGVSLEGLGREATLEFDLRLVDGGGRTIEAPRDLLIGVAEPTLHDLDAYGKSRGIVLVSIDTLRRDHVGAYGYAKPTTPRLDGLARHGILAEDAVATSSWTLPSHLSLFTSTDPAVHGGTDMKRGYNHRVPSLARILREAGYATQAVTSHLYVSGVYGLDDGFDQLDFHQDRLATDVAERAISLLDRFGDRPFFLFVHFYDPHWHYNPPEAQRLLFDTGYAGGLSGVWGEFKDKTRETTTPEELAHILALYDGEIRYVDDELGRVLDHMSARGLDAGTLVVVTSDHGEEFLDHGSWEHQKTLYEEVVRIPLVVSGPGVPVRREPAQASLLDVAPTILAWAGLPAQPTHEGRSLLAPLPDRDGYGETDHTTDGTSKLFLRGGAGRFKTILSLDRASGEPRKEEWYDLRADPAEQRDVRPRADVADAIRKRALARWRDGRARGMGAPAVELTPEQRERLRALGYVGS
jgi:arylsulfatase A-like enzyme